MFWLMHILLSFVIIQALIPVIIILILIAAAAGLTRGMDMFALLGLGSLMGFANSGGGRVGKGLRGARFGSDAVRRNRAAAKAKGGLLKKAKAAKKTVAARKSPAVRAKRQQYRDRMQAGRTKRAAFMNRRLKSLQKRGKGNSFRARLIKKDLAHIRKQDIKNSRIKAREANIAKVSSQLQNLKPGMAVPAAIGGVGLGRLERWRIKKAINKKDKLSNELNAKNQALGYKRGQYVKANNYIVNQFFKNKGIQRPANRLEALEQMRGAKSTRLISASSEGIRLGKVPKFNYVRTSKSATGKDVNVLTIPKSSFVQKGATASIGLSMLQRHWEKKAMGTGKSADSALKNLNKLNDMIAKRYYKEGSAAKAFSKNEEGKLRSVSSQRMKNFVNISLPVPFVSTANKIIGRRFGEEKIDRMPDEPYWDYRARAKKFEKWQREDTANKSHTFRHPIRGAHGTDTLQTKINKLDTYLSERARKNTPK